MLANHMLETHRLKLQHYMATLPMQAQARIVAERNLLARHIDSIKNSTAQAMLKEQMRIKNLDDKVQLLSPRNILNRGYSLTMAGGHVVTDGSQLKSGDIITTLFKNGKVKSVVSNSITQTNQ